MGLAVTKSDVLDIIKECFSEEGLVEPITLDDDFDGLDFRPLTSFSSIVKFCKQVNKRVLSSVEREWMYRDVISIVATPVRFRIVQQLGFEEYIDLERDSGLSYRAFFRRFLGGLDEGEEWTIGMFKEWECEGTTGLQYYYRLVQVCGWNLEVVKAIIGDDAEALLARNPCVSNFKPQVLKSAVVARKYLVYYFRSLPVGARWSCDTLRNWVGVNGVNGNSLYYWMNNNLVGGVSSDSLRGVLTNDYLDLLVDHPYAAYEIKLRSLSDVKNYLVEFLEGLDEGEDWWSNKLGEWVAKDGFNGRNIRFFVVRNVGSFDECVIRDILGEDADEFLLRNPFVVIEKKVDSIEVVKRCLIEFLRTLERGKAWSVAMLRAWKSLDGVAGKNVYRWITRNVRSFVSERALVQVLGEDSRRLLRRNPFERKSDDRFYVRLFFRDFFESLHEGEKWNIQKLRSWENVDGISGRIIYGWIVENVRHEGKVDWMYVLLKFVDSEMIEKHPFVYRGMNVLASDQSFVTSRPQFEKMNLGRGVVDKEAVDPENLLIEEEESRAMAFEFSRIREVMGELSVEERLIVEQFLNDEVVDQQVFFAIVVKLKQILGVD